MKRYILTILIFICALHDPCVRVFISDYHQLNSIILTRTKKIRDMISQSEAEKRLTCLGKLKVFFRYNICIRLLMKRLEQFGMVAFRMSPPSPQYDQLSQPKTELHTPPPLAIEDPLLPLSAHGNY